jgi:hypothetical protein
MTLDDFQLESFSSLILLLVVVGNLQVLREMRHHSKILEIASMTAPS